MFTLLSSQDLYNKIITYLQCTVFVVSWCVCPTQKTLAYYEICLFPIGYEALMFHTTGPRSLNLFVYLYLGLPVRQGIPICLSARHSNFCPPVANVIKLFSRNYATISIASVKITGKYATGGVNYDKKVL
jgi:hypothetical protein